MSTDLLFASYTPATLEPKDSIGAKWVRLLERLDLKTVVAGKRTAIETASLDLIKPAALIPGSLPKGLKLGRRGHLFQRIHSKDPFVVLHALAELGCGQPEYQLVEVQ